MHNTATARIDLSALVDNLSVVRRLCPRSRVMAMIKADGYGHGLIPVAKTLSRADGLGVARLQEALALRDAGITQRILLVATVLGPADLTICSNQNIDVTAHDHTSVSAIAAAAAHHPLRVWLELDSGMHRVGLDPQAFVEADRLLTAITGISELTHMTHFSSADEPGGQILDRQLQSFFDCHRHNPTVKASLANSAALISRPDTHADWVRPGIMLYGGSPGSTHPVPLRPAMTLTTRIIALRELGVGEPVGYNRRWRTARKSRIATLGIGYGDGYPRHAANGTPVCVNGRLAPLVGCVSMDSLAADVTDCGPVAVGDEAVLWGEELPATLVAEHAETINYALFAALGKRVTREYASARRWLLAGRGATA